MRNPFTIEDIEEMRRREGIDDVELREEVCRLGVGDRVRLTLLRGSQSAAGETVVVQITSVRGVAFHGKLLTPSASANLSGLGIRSRLLFTAAHIHSIPIGPRARAR